MILIFLVALISVIFISYIGYIISKMIINSFKIEEIAKQTALTILLTIGIITMIIFLIITYFK